jgi:hypothetical protein
MALDKGTFDYMKPSEVQVAAMAELRSAAKDYAVMIEGLVPEGPDRTHCLRLLRTVAMWVNVALTRQPDGAPRL